MVENLGHLEIMNGLETDLLIDPRNPNFIVSYMQRHRTVWLFRRWTRNIIYKSNDGGDNWIKLKTGLPTTMGKLHEFFSQNQT